MPAIEVKPQAEMLMQPVPVELSRGNVDRVIPSGERCKVDCHLERQVGQLFARELKLVQRTFLIDSFGYQDGESEHRDNGRCHQHADYRDHPIAEPMAPHDAPLGFLVPRPRP
jgi:hypothetical protein